MKVALFLRESGPPCAAIPVDTRKVEPHAAIRRPMRALQALDFKAEMDDEARRALFPQNERLKG